MNDWQNTKLGEELERLREREKGYLSELRDYGETVKGLRATVREAATGLDKLTMTLHDRDEEIILLKAQREKMEADREIMKAELVKKHEYIERLAEELAASRKGSPTELQYRCAKLEQMMGQIALILRTDITRENP
jgi:chromosome segregation ATPase